jgi:hypothetical protein
MTLVEDPAMSAATVLTAESIATPSPASNAINKLRTAWHGATIVLKKVERCLDNTPAKAPIAAFNALIEIGNVRSLLGVFYIAR